LALILWAGAARADMSHDQQLIPTADRGDLERVQILLHKGADVNATRAYGRTALMEAALAGHLPVVSLLLDHGAEVNAQDREGQTAVSLAASARHSEVVRALKNRGAVFTLIDAVRVADMEQVELLLKQGHDPRAKEADSGRTALAEAALTGRLELVRLLLEKGAEIHTTDCAGYTPISLAALRGHLDVVRLLRENEVQQTARVEQVGYAHEIPNH